MSLAVLLFVQLVPHVLLAAVGIGFFGRYRTLPTALAAAGFLVAVISDLANAWAVARWTGLAGVWVGSIGLLWHLLSARKRHVT